MTSQQLELIAPWQLWPLARIRSLCRRRKQAYEAVYHSSANSVGHSIAGFSATRTTENPPLPSNDDRFRAALRREMAKAGLA